MPPNEYKFPVLSKKWEQNTLVGGLLVSRNHQFLMRYHWRRFPPDRPLLSFSFINPRPLIVSPMKWAWPLSPSFNMGWWGHSNPQNGSSDMLPSIQWHPPQPSTSYSLDAKICQLLPYPITWLKPLLTSHWHHCFDANNFLVWPHSFLLGPSRVFFQRIFYP